MPQITLPDGSIRSFDHDVSILAVAEDIGAGLARATLAGKVDGELKDASAMLTSDCALSLITDKDPEGIEILRHSCAHLLAQAIKALYPAAQIAIGPVIENGFYYDLRLAQSLGPDDLVALEKKMQELAKQDMPVQRLEMTRDEAITHFEKLGESYKVKIIQDIPGNEVLSFYQQGDFIDLCRGPHVPSTGKIKAFKLMKLAGAYWRGDSNNEMLQRIYGTAWPDKKALKLYLHQLEEAEKRDHRKLAKQMDLFHLQEDAPGMVFWHPNGWTIYQEVVGFIRELLRNEDYNEIKTPQIADRSLWEKSGHWDMYQEHMFTTESESRSYAIKPMSCPCHVQVFNQGVKSYRDLPLRLSEFGSCHRNEHSGTLHGLMRVRAFVQDDAHIFCTHEQVQREALSFIKLFKKAYQAFGFKDFIIGLSTRPDKRIGDDALWDRAENDLKKALDEAGIEWVLQEGDGAFYGPKIDFSMKDCLGRVWQTGTLQLDYSLPGRLGAHYVAEDGSKQVPIMLHRAILGSVERFVGVLIEQYAGKFPVWLSPTQVVVMTITDRQAEYVAKITKTLKKHTIRSISDLRNEKIGYKIREHTLQRIPYQVVVGDKELENETVSVRTREGVDLGAMSLEALMDMITDKIHDKSLNL